MASYHPIPSSDAMFDDYLPEKPTLRERLSRSRRSWPCLVVLILSIMSNIVLVQIVSTSSTPFNNGTTSEFARLPRNVAKQWNLNRFTTEAEWTEIWDNQSSYDAGVIALDDDYARAKGLPRSQRWPWDQTKGIYLLNAYHNLHCVKNLRSSIEEFKVGREQSIPWAHVQHCLLVLRDEIMCNADDTPRYSGYQPDHHSGYGQWRLCREWSGLEAWAQDKTRSGCWKHIPGEHGVDGFDRLDRYRFCPAGSQYKEMSETTWKGGQQRQPPN